MKCPGCGKKIPSGSTVCPYCGVRKECLACASDLTLGSSFCPLCGSHLVILRPDPDRQEKSPAGNMIFIIIPAGFSTFSLSPIFKEWFAALLRRECGQLSAESD